MTKNEAFWFLSLMITDALLQILEITSHIFSPPWIMTCPFSCGISIFQAGFIGDQTFICKSNSALSGHPATLCCQRGKQVKSRGNADISEGRREEERRAPRNINLPPNFYLPSCCRCSIANSTGGAQWRKEQTGTWPFQIAVSLNILQGPIRNSILHQTAVNEPSCIVQDLFK